MKTLTVWTVCGYDQEIATQLTNNVIFRVFASNSQEAIEKCKALIDKPNYRIAEANELLDPIEMTGRQMKGLRKNPWEKDDE